MQVNRYLKNKDMDHIDHALGRPVDPTSETFRNHFACSGSHSIENMRQSPNWSEDGAMGDMIFFSVNDTGRKALKHHLKEIGDKNRLFAVKFDGEDCSPVVAITRSKARYSAWLNISDTWAELTFKDFCKRSSIRLA